MVATSMYQVYQSVNLDQQMKSQNVWCASSGYSAFGAPVRGYTSPQIIVGPQYYQAMLERTSVAPKPNPNGYRARQRKGRNARNVRP